MIKCEVIERFDLKDFNKLKNIQRKATNVEGKLFVGDTFECDEEMAKYLLGDNVLKKTVVKVLEVEPKKDMTEMEFEIRSEEVKELVKEKQKEVEKIIKPKKKKK